MDDLIYATVIHASNHLCANGNLDGYVMLIVVLVFGADPLCYRMLNELLMRGLFDLEIPVRNNCPVYTFFFVFPLISLSNPHSFITTSYVPIYPYFPSLTMCLYT